MTAGNPRFAQIFRERRTPPGSPPGTLIPVPDSRAPIIQVMAYGANEYVERIVTELDEITPFLDAYPVTWVNVDGLGDLDLIRSLGEMFQLHRLALEDVVNLHQRAKADDYDQCIYFVTHMVTFEDALVTEQLSLFLGRNFVISFQHLPGDSLDTVRARIRSGAGQIRLSGPDYLLYSLIDAVLDNYFPVLERYGEQLELLEDDAVAQPDAAVRKRIHDVRHDMRTLRRAIWPHREALNQLSRDPNPLISAETRIYLRDIYDHTIQLMDLIETYRELGSDLMDLYLSGVSNRMNEIMKVLTIIATIFIPLSFVAGVYGMNFNTRASPLNMPELDWYFGYPFALALMTAVALVLIGYFRRRRWM